LTDARLWRPWLRINRVLRAMLHELRVDLSPEGDEGWRRKARRSLRAVRNATVSQSEHERGR